MGCIIVSDTFYLQHQDPVEHRGSDIRYDRRDFQDSFIHGAMGRIVAIDEVNEYYLNCVSAILRIPKRFLIDRIYVYSRMYNKASAIDFDINELKSQRDEHNQHPTENELDIIKLLIKREIIPEIIAKAYLICSVCKSGKYNKNEYPCKYCHILTPNSQFTFKPIYRYKNSICKFCKTELKHRINDITNKEKAIIIGKDGLIL